MKEHTRDLIGEKTDVFSFGMCLWELFSDPPKYPWQGVIKNGDKRSMFLAKHKSSKTKTNCY
jgi:hypothetical protein